eukprot:TRINITY_DN12129_c0_g1_i1.p1 TRINITY_DN12129_c0_g1~~TRINITY_DN12129_c0_g1_i1.p1  ORF type:complete len:436 (+),score=120.64 TRINITY_DN12129_c0_g1_i1:80-1387(+)
MTAPHMWDRLPGHEESCRWLQDTARRQQELEEMAENGDLEGLLDKCSSPSERAALAERLDPFTTADINRDTSSAALDVLKTLQGTAQAGSSQAANAARDSIDEAAQTFRAQDHHQKKQEIETLLVQKVEEVKNKNALVAQFADPTSMHGQKAILRAEYGEDSLATMTSVDKEQKFCATKEKRIQNREAVLLANGRQVLDSSVPAELQVILEQRQQAESLDREVAAATSDEARAKSMRSSLGDSLNLEKQQRAECSKFKKAAYEDLYRAEKEEAKAYSIFKQKEAQRQKCYITHEAARILLQRKDAAMDSLQREHEAVSEGLDEAVAACCQRRDAAQKDAENLRAHAAQALRDLMALAQEPLKAAMLNNQIVEKWFVDLSADKDDELAYRVAAKSEAQETLQRLTTQMDHPTPDLDVSRIQDKRATQGPSTFFQTQ